MRLKDFNETFASELKDPEFQAEYLKAALADSPEAFLVALREVAQANMGMGQLAQRTGRGRESMYKALSRTGNPGFAAVSSMLEAMDLEFSVRRKRRAKREDTGLKTGL
jgi:probable addiction module antidote protein